MADEKRSAAAAGSRSTREGEAQVPPDMVGLPMRSDDRQNQFRAPDIKAFGAIFGEDMTQPGPPPEAPEAGSKEGAVDVPAETHAQVAPPLAAQKPPEMEKPEGQPPLGGSRQSSR
jgi:hypothetical protein